MKKAVSIKKNHGMYAIVGYFKENDTKGIIKFVKKEVEKTILKYPYADISISINAVEEDDEHKK